MCPDPFSYFEGDFSKKQAGTIAHENMAAWRLPLIS
jgi:hypothetical protein